MLEDFVRRVFDAIPAEVRELPVLAGGALRSYFDGTPTKDYDLFFRSHADYLVVKEAMRETSIELPTEYSGTNNLASDGALYNLVGFEFKSPQEQIDRFDFRCCQMAAWMEGGNVRTIFNDHSIGDALLKRLVVLNNNGEERTLRRIRHYIDDYGYTVYSPALGVFVCEEEEKDPPRPIAFEEVRKLIRSLPSGRGPYGG